MDVTTGHGILAARNRGFTLVEIAVVIFIIATVSAISLMAVYQAGDRGRYSQAERLQVWLQQLSDRAMLEGISYGVRAGETSLRATVYFRQRWFYAADPEPFTLQDEAHFSWHLLGPSERSTDPGRDQDGNEILVPDFTLSPEGALEPDVSMQLAYSGTPRIFEWRWNADESMLQMRVREP